MKYQDIINKLTLDEKCSLLSGGGQFYTKTVKRMGIPSMYLSDGPHGLRKQVGVADHLGLNASQPATCYPTAVTMANSWDVELGETLGGYLGEEAVAFNVNVLLGPGLNVKRSPLCGRNFEYFSEDPYLAGKMAAAYIRGIQSKGIAACPKHFAVNSQERLRMHNDSVLDERTLREIYLTGFEIAVKEGKPLSLMTSYNKVNGTYANENCHLLRDILAEDWGFEGLVVTDWGGSNDRVEGLIAGNQLEMPTTNGDSDRELVAAVKAGRISESLVDERVDEYLRILFSTVIPEDAPDFDLKAHHIFAQKAAESAIVLLKNEDAILPLKAGTKAAVIGDFAEMPRYQGFGSSAVNATQVDSPLGSLKTSTLDITGYSKGFHRHGKEDANLRGIAVEMAKDSEVVLLYLGLDEISEVEGMERSHMRVHQNQVDLLEAVSAVNPNIIVILSGGSPIEVPWLSKCKAMLHGYLGGQAGAGAMSDVLTGKASPSGKLSETWPMTYEDTPAFRYYPGLEKTSEYREGIYVGYRYYNTAGIPVRFPFGFGLSYTNFVYSDLQANEWGVKFTLTNTGSYPGSEIAQLYIGMKKSAVFRSARELKGFAKVMLQPGEKKTVTISYDDKTFRYFNVETELFETESGTYFIEVGASIEDIRLIDEVSIHGERSSMPYSQNQLPSYYAGRIADVSDGEFEALLGRKIPKTKWERSKPLESNDTFSQLFYAKGWIGRLVHRILIRLKNKAEKKGKPDLNILFIYNLPFRGIAKMMGRTVDRKMADAIVEIFNGHFFRGLGHLITAWRHKGRDTRETQHKLADALTSAKTKEVANEHIKH